MSMFAASGLLTFAVGRGYLDTNVVRNVRKVKATKNLVIVGQRFWQAVTSRGGVSRRARQCEDALGSSPRGLGLAVEAPDRDRRSPTMARRYRPGPSLGLATGPIPGLSAYAHTLGRCSPRLRPSRERLYSLPGLHHGANAAPEAGQACR